MKKFIEQINKIECDYQIADLFLNENKAEKLVKQLKNGDIDLINDLELFDKIIYTDKLNWIEFNYNLKNKIDKVNYLTNCDNYQYDKFNEMIEDSANTTTIHYNDQLDLGMIRYDFENIILFDKEHKNEVKSLLKDKVEDLVDLAVEKGTPVLQKAADDLRDKAIVVTKEVLKKLEKEDKK